jgi:gliding motility associated protien GldN
MEDWVFDYKHSVFKPRIIALAPIFAPTYAGLTVNDQPLCWIKMDEIRYQLANLEMFNRYNDAARLSYDDFFQMRIFDSYIVYESNVFDNFINQYQEYTDNGEASLLKSDEIKNDLFIFEHDLWQY